MKQTAVEWLIEQWPILESQIPERILEQAKEMEKEQIINSFNQGYTQCSIEDLKPTSRKRYEDAEQYYNETFKSE
jgi:hypothetical protein